MEEEILNIANKIKSSGGNLYLVGGAIRDELLGNKTHDKDYCVTGLSSKEFKELFPQAIIRGNSFPVFILNGSEFALARIERKNGIGHKEFNIITDKSITIEQDLSRRDITINSIAQEVLTGKLIDPFNGITDIQEKIIKATTNHFLEDPLRVYRVARFAAQLDFTVEEKTLELMNKSRKELNTLSKERIFTEFLKALETKRPSIFFEVLKNAKVLDVHFPEIHNLIGALQPIQYHPEGDAYNHTMLAVDESAKLTQNPEYRFCALVHDLGKGITPKEEYPHHYNHETNGVPLVEKLGNRIGIPNKWINSGKIACKEHMRGGIFYKMKPAKKVEFIERISKTRLGLHGLQIVVYSDKLSSRTIDAGSIDFESVGKRCLEAVDGKCIKEKYNLAEGLDFGNKLHQERIEWMKSLIE